MIKIKFIVAALLAIGILLVGGGCASSENVAAGLGQEFTLAVGQTATIQDEQLKIKFVEVIGDSRCPSDVQCIWQGEVSCKLEITLQGTTDTKVLTQPGLTQGPAISDFAGYQLQFNVQPYPKSGKKIQTMDYRLQMTVTKKPSS